MKKSYTFLPLLFLANAILHAQDGTLDLSFGTNGIAVHTPFDANSRIISLIKHEDHLYAAGFTRPDTRDVFSIAKFDLNGELDTEFGTDGLLIPALSNGNSNANVILRRPDGKFLAAGWARTINKDVYTVVCFDAHGVIDSTFGTDGIASGSWNNSSFAEDEIQDAAFLSDSRLITVAKSYNGANNDVAIACFNTDGSPCDNFGEDGVVVIEFDESSGWESAAAVAIDQNDNIIVGGEIKLNPVDDASFFIIKLNASGQRDMTFGGSGIVIRTLGAEIIAGLNAIAIDSEGRIVTGGGAFDTDEVDNEFFLTRYSNQGVSDASFGDNGIVILSGPQNESVLDLEILPSGNILAAGSTGGFGSRFIIARLGNDGDLDLSFGTNGYAYTLIDPTFNGIESICIDEDGSIYSGGYAYNGTLWKMAMAKYKNQTSSVAPLNLIEESIQIIPNPVVANFLVTFELAENADVSIQILDVFGRIVSEIFTGEKLFQGSHQMHVDIPQSLSAGTYMVRIDTGMGAMTKAIAVVR